MLKINGTGWELTVSLSLHLTFFSILALSWPCLLFSQAWSSWHRPYLEKARFKYGCKKFSSREKKKEVGTDFKISKPPWETKESEVHLHTYVPMNDRKSNLLMRFRLTANLLALLLICSVEYSGSGIFLLYSSYSF